MLSAACVNGLKMYRLYGKFQCYVSHGLCTPRLIFSYKWPYYLRELARNGGSNPYKHVRWVSPIISVSIWCSLCVIKTLETTFRWSRPVLKAATLLFAFRLCTCDATSKLYYLPIAVSALFRRILQT